MSRRHLSSVAPAVLAALLGAVPFAVAQDDGSSVESEPPSEDGSGTTAPVRVGPDVPYTPPPTGEDDEEGGTSPPSRYDPEGRRDPFRPLVGPGQLQTLAEEKCEGELRCITLQEVKLTSIVKTPKGNLCLLEGGPRKEGFYAKEGDRLKNGYVFRIDPDRLVVTIREELDDKRLLKPYRDWNWSLYREDEGAPVKGRPAGM